MSDWVAGSYARLDQATLDLAQVQLAVGWHVVLPSGLVTGGLNPHAYRADPDVTLDQAIEGVASEIAAAQEIPVELPNEPGMQINPDGTKTATGGWTPPDPGPPDPTPPQQPPHITALSPTLGSFGTQVVISGVGLSGIPANGVDFGGYLTTDAKAVNDGQVTCSVPHAPVGGCFVHVTVGGYVNPEAFPFMVNP